MVCAGVVFGVRSCLLLCVSCLVMPRWFCDIKVRYIFVLHLCNIS
uniref:Uncharacterized protein n=1 Tax=Siphoviridae sp. ctqPo10 TaxID=2827948 RepID=A0A8S5SUP8_9CAUD|nr:MAG TPA: hypothetical protein [Siphoviridae sp. ctqPo10]